MSISYEYHDCNAQSNSRKKRVSKNASKFVSKVLLFYHHAIVLLNFLL